MPTTIKDEDKPVTMEIDQSTASTSYVIRDATGIERARFVEQEEANAYMAMVHAIPPPALMQEDMDDKGVEHDQEDREQQEVDDMPRGIPKAKKRVAKAKKRVAAVKKQAASVKKTAKKVTDRVAKRRKKKAK